MTSLAERPAPTAAWPPHHDDGDADDAPTDMFPVYRAPEPRLPLDRPGWPADQRNVRTGPDTTWYPGRDRDRDTAPDWWAGMRARRRHHVPVNAERRMVDHELRAIAYCGEACVKLANTSKDFPACRECAAYVDTLPQHLRRW